MRCLYCGKELALFKRLRGGEFCSDAHRQRYQEEYTQLALNRLLQANAPKDQEYKEYDPLENESKELQIKDSQPKESYKETAAADTVISPALKRRERVAREELSPASMAATPPPALPAPLPAPLSAQPVSAQPAQSLPAARTAVLESEQSKGPAPVFKPAPEPQSAPPPEIQGPSVPSFLVEFPAPAAPAPPAPVFDSAQLPAAPALALPRLQEFQPDPDAAHLDPAERITLSLFALADFPSPPRERGLELREFVRGVPQVEIHVKPAVESGFEVVKEGFAVEIESAPPQEAPALWLASEVEHPLGGQDAEIQLGDLARLDFALTEWGVGFDGEAGTEMSGEPETGGPALAARIEPAKVEPVPHEPAPFAAARPEPVYFEPVHIDPTFMERIAATTVVSEEPHSETSGGEDAMASDQGRPAVVTEAAFAESQPEPEPAVEPLPETTAPVNQEAAPPAGITRPLPVTLHGLAPLRGKPIQAFTAALARNGGIQIPDAMGLPLRPVMVLGAAAKPAVPTLEPEPAAVAKSIPIPEKVEPTENKPRRSEVRVLPVQVKQPVKPEAKPAYRIEPARSEQARSEPVKSEAKKSEVVKEGAPVAGRPRSAQPPVKAAAPLTDSKPADSKPADSKPAEAKQAEVKPAESKSGNTKPAVTAAPNKPQPEKTAADVRTPVRPPAPAEEPLDLLGLPKLSFQQKETFWSKLPGTARLGIIAAALALIVGGVVLTSRGSGSAKPAVAVAPEPVYVEEPAMGNTAGWIQDWFADRAGGKQGRHVDVLRGSLAARDYRLLFEGQIERGALGWVFRADEKSFYVEKIQVLTPGRDPVVALVRFAVINGVEQNRIQVPLSLQAHLDTLYKVRMDIVGDKFTTWIQDEKVDQWTDNQLAVGGVGLYYDSGDSAKLRDTLNVIPLKRK